MRCHYGDLFPNCNRINADLSTVHRCGPHRFNRRTRVQWWAGPSRAIVMSRVANTPPSPPAHSPGRQLLDGTLWVMLAEALFPITAIVTAGVLTRKLSPDEYGRLNLSVTFAGWSVGILLALFGRAIVLVVRRATDWQGAAATIFRRQLAASILVLAGVLLSADRIADAWQAPGLAAELRLMAFEIPFASSALVLRQILIARGRFRQRAFGGAVRWLVRMCLVVLLVELGFGVRGAIAGLVMTAAIDLGLGWLFTAIPLRNTSRVGWREFAGLAMPMFLTAISLRTFERIDLFALQTLGADAAQTALYGAAQNLALTPVWLAQSMLSLSLSSVAQLVIAGDLPGGRILARQTARASVRCSLTGVCDVDFCRHRSSPGLGCRSLAHVIRPLGVAGGADYSTGSAVNRCSCGGDSTFGLDGCSAHHARPDLVVRSGFWVYALSPDRRGGSCGDAAAVGGVVGRRLFPGTILAAERRLDSAEVAGPGRVLRRHLDHSGRISE